MLLVLAMRFSAAACGKKNSEPILSLEEMVNDPEFQKIYEDSEDEYFKVTVSAEGTVMTFRVDAKKTYAGEDLDFYRKLTADDISDKFGLADMQKLLKRRGFGDVVIEYKMYNGDGVLMNEKTFQ